MLQSGNENREPRHEGRNRHFSDVRARKMGLETAIRYSDATVQKSLVATATRLGISHRIETDGTVIYDSEDPKVLKDDPGIIALDKALGSEWIAVQIDSEDQLSEIQSDLSRESIRFVTAWENDRIYVNLTRFECPQKWEGHQV